MIKSKQLLVTSLMIMYGIIDCMAQVYYPDNTLKLNPVWSRVADVFGEAGSIESAEFSADGRYIVSGSKFDNSIIMWRTSDGHELWRQYAEQEIERVGWSADGEYVASCSEDFLVQVWDASTGDLLENIPHNDGIDALIWSNKGSLLLTGEEETENPDNPEQKSGWLKVFDYSEGQSKLLQKVDCGGTINELKFTDDDQYLLAAGHGFVKVFRTSDMELLQTLGPGHFYKFVTAEFTPDGQYIAAGGGGGHLYVWDWKTGELVQEFNYRGRKIESLCWHPSGDYLLTSGHGPYINVFRSADIFIGKIAEMPVVAQINGFDAIEYIDFNKDGSFLVSAHQDGVIRLWVWKGEDWQLNKRRHAEIKKIQSAAKKMP